jgi:hypothetical protein
VGRGSAFAVDGGKGQKIAGRCPLQRGLPPVSHSRRRLAAVAAVAADALLAEGSRRYPGFRPTRNMDLRPPFGIRGFRYYPVLLPCDSPGCWRHLKRLASIAITVTRWSSSKRQDSSFTFGIRDDMVYDKAMGDREGITTNKITPLMSVSLLCLGDGVCCLRVDDIDYSFRFYAVVWGPRWLWKWI